MKKRSKKLSKIVALATSEERRFGAETGKSRRTLEEQKSRLGELNAYRHGYKDVSQSLSKMNSAHWKDYQDFLQRLDRALISQQQIVRDSEQNLEMHRRRWMAKRQRLESLQRVLDRYREEEFQHAERQQQRAQDDLPGPENPFSEDSDR